MVEISTMVAPGITALVKFCRDPGETITTVVNNSPTNVAGSTGDGGLATAATLNSAWGVAVDGDVLYVSELTGNRVRKVLLTGARTISLYAGTGAGGLGDEGAATSARLSAPRGLFAGNGNLYIGDNANNRIRKIDGGGIITTVAGGGVIPTGDGGPATAAHFGVPFGAAVGPDGSLYVGEVSGHRVRRIYPSGLITTVAGTGVAGFTADGLPATESMINAPFDVTVDPSGNVYFTDYNNNLVRKVTASTGLLSTVAGNRVAGTTGDGGNALNAAVNGPQGLAIGPGPAFDLFISTTGNPRVRKVSMATGIITTIAGNASVNGGGLGDTVGDNGGATSAGLATPRGIAFDAAGNLYIANISNRVRKVTPGDNLVMDGLVPYPMVPGGCDPASPTSEMAELPTFVPPNTLTTTLVRWCRDPGEDISTFVGASGDVPVAGVTGDGGQAKDARLNTAFGVAVDETQNVYIVEMGGARVRKVDPSGIITTIAGSGVSGFSGDGGPATAATFNGPRDVVVDDAGNVYVIDGSNNRIRRLDLAAKSVSINIDADGDGGIAAMAELFSVRSPSTLGDASLRTVDAQGAATSAAPVSGTADPRPDPFDAQKKVYAFGPDDGRLAGNRFRLESRFDDQRTFSGDARFFIAWHPAHMLYGAPLSSAQLDASASVPGSFTFHMAAGDVVGGAVLAPGKDQPIAAHFTPADASLGTADWTARIDVLYQGAGTTCFGAPGHAILPPINANGTSVFRKGSTVLAKLRVCDANGVSLGTPGVVVSFRLVRIIAGTVTDVNEPVESGTPDQAFRWDAGAMQWLFNIDTSDLDKDTTYVFEATLGDGTSVRFQFGLR